MSSNELAASVTLLGLPGSGKDRVKRALVEQFGYDPQRIVTSVMIPSAKTGQAWCVIDVRPLVGIALGGAVEKHLQSLLAYADGVIFSFVEAADLEAQAFWTQWVRQQESNVPIVRLLNRRFPESWSGFEIDETEKEKSGEPLPPLTLQCFEFEVGRVHLDHLMMGLDNSRQNLGVDIWRVQAVIDTFEYENTVAVEATPFRWDCYAAGLDQAPGKIRIEGIDLDKRWLNEIIQASLLRP
ncbi:hypothetical protein QCB44_07230 [Thiomicrorhabdus sp. zzn3]|uniref:hypothetical protein n=1 Tax=Thiomicrorhabdus sp. zzn3 TaxID=3039775 RepID=UPI0024368F5D|nr:hypothetical protein [Thiomicrorhabdus sp. zzn3]MDG6778492.1 hypothetical protein [Thiomicrorhabdus sp. zzn3]